MLQEGSGSPERAFLQMLSSVPEGSVQVPNITQTPDRQYGVLTHIDDFKGFLTS